MQPTVAPPVATAVAAPVRNTVSGCVSNAAPGADLFPDKAKIVEAKGLRIRYAGNYKVVEVTNPWRGAKSGFTYVLVQCGTKAPELTGPLAGATVINVPITAASIMSTTLAPMFDTLGVADKVVSVDEPSYYSTPSITKRIEAGQIKASGSGAKTNLELLVSLKPSVVITSGTSSASTDGINKMAASGLTPLVEAGYMEETPLGRSEWVKLIGALNNQEAAAESQFARWRSDYQALAAKAAKAKTRPVVISGSSYQGTWYAPGGKSFVAQFISDAGGRYPWDADTSTGSLSLDFEAVFSKASDATFWINAGYQWADLKQVAAEDARYAQLNPYSVGNVYGNDKRVNPTGGSDYFETAVLRPDLVLADLVSIFHPEILGSHNAIWFRRIPR